MQCNVANSRDLNNIGFCYQNGLGIEVKVSEAIRLYKMVLDKNNFISLHNLAKCYENEEISEAIQIYQKASDGVINMPVYMKLVMALKRINQKRLNCMNLHLTEVI